MASAHKRLFHTEVWKSLLHSPAANANWLRILMFCASPGTIGAEVVLVFVIVCYFAANAIA